MTIEAVALSKVFDGRPAVDGLSLTISSGEVFGLLGPNGAGKTTTIRMLTGLVRPTGGTAVVCGIDVSDARRSSQLRRRIGLLTENPGHYDRLTARENLEFFVRLNELDPPHAWKVASHYLARFGLEARMEDAVGTFSKGMRQKLAIVRALIHEPEVLFLDEPTSGLDPQAARAVRDAIEELGKEGRTLVLCSHNLAEVERLCERVAIVHTQLKLVASLADLRRDGNAVEIVVDGLAERFSGAAHRTATPARLRFEGSKLTAFGGSVEHVSDLVAALVSQGARIRSVLPVQRALEEAYLELLGPIASEGRASP